MTAREQSKGIIDRADSNDGNNATWRRNIDCSVFCCYSTIRTARKTGSHLRDSERAFSLPCPAIPIRFVVLQFVLGSIFRGGLNGTVVPFWFLIARSAIAWWPGSYSGFYSNVLHCARARVRDEELHQLHGPSQVRRTQPPCGGLIDT